MGQLRSLCPRGAAQLASSQSPCKDVRRPQNIALAEEWRAASPWPGCISPRSERHCCPSLLQNAATSPAWSWPCSVGWCAISCPERTCPEPSSIAGGGGRCVYVAGRMQIHSVTVGTTLGSRQDGAARVPSAITNSSCSGHVFAFACLIFSTPFATLLPAPSLHLSLLFPILPLFFCFFSFCSSCLSRAAARGDGVVGSSGRWAACRGAFGSSPGSRQARGVRPGTCNHAPRAGAGTGGSRANLRHATCPHSRAQANMCLLAVPGDQPCSPALGRHWDHTCPGSCLGCNTCCPVPVVRDAHGSQTRLALLPGVLPGSLGAAGGTWRVVRDG